MSVATKQSLSLLALPIRDALVSADSRMLCGQYKLENLMQESTDIRLYSEKGKNLGIVSKTAIGESDSSITATIDGVFRVDYEKIEGKTIYMKLDPLDRASHNAMGRFIMFLK